MVARISELEKHLEEYQKEETSDEESWKKEQQKLGKEIDSNAEGILNNFKAIYTQKGELQNQIQKADGRIGKHETHQTSL